MRPFKGMSRVEPNRNDDKRESRERSEQEPDKLDRTPGKAEGDENTVDEALRNSSERNERE